MHHLTDLDHLYAGISNIIGYIHEKEHDQLSGWVICQEKPCKTWRFIGDQIAGDYKFHKDYGDDLIETLRAKEKETEELRGIAKEFLAVAVVEDKGILYPRYWKCLYCRGKWDENGVVYPHEKDCLVNRTPQLLGIKK